MDSSVFILITGMSKEYAKPFVIDDPILRPVYEPGPELIAMASSLSKERLTSSKIDLTNNARDSACVFTF